MPTAKTKRAPKAKTSPDDLRIIQLTAGDIGNNYLRVRGAKELLAPECIGGASRGARCPLVLEFEDGTRLETEVVGLMIRDRSNDGIRGFCTRTGAQPGDF